MIVFQVPEIITKQSDLKLILPNVVFSKMSFCVCAIINACQVIFFIHYTCINALMHLC